MGSTTTARGLWQRDGMAAEQEFAEFVTARQQRLLGFAYLLTGSPHEAEDLVQSALAKTFLSWDRLRDRGSLDAYVRRIVVNEHRSLWRRAWRRFERPTDALPELVPAPPGPDIETRDALWRLVGTLPPRQRAVIVLRYYEDLSEADTAEVLGCSVGTVKSQASRALTTLRGRVADDPELLGGDHHG